MKKAFVTVVLVLVLVFNLFAFSFAEVSPDIAFEVETAAAPRLTYQITVSGQYIGRLYCNGGQFIANNCPYYYKFIEVGGYNAYTWADEPVSVFVSDMEYAMYDVEAVCATSVNYPTAGYGGSGTAYYYAP